MSTTKMKATPPPPPLFDKLPSELHVHILTYLRAYDLSALNQTCHFFASPTLVHHVIKHTAEHVYPSQLTEGFGLEGKEYTFESLRNMEWLVVARVLSRPEPISGGYYVSKSWCKTALKWLEVQQEEENQRKQHSGGKKKTAKLSKKQQRMRSRRLSDANPPWPNVTSDLLCCHENLQHCQSTKSARAKRRLLDKQAWKVLKKLYPDSVSLDSHSGECLQCRVEVESAKRERKQVQEIEHEERRRPLSCSIVRGIYTRTRGVPAQSLERDESGGQPLVPGLYHVLPRVWLHQWRRYIKTGDGGRPCAPDGSALLCHGHRLPLLPPHLEAYLYGETSQLLTSVECDVLTSPSTPCSSPAAAGLPVGMSQVDLETWNALRAAGVSEQELEAQRALSNRELRSPRTPKLNRPRSQLSINELIDMENNVVVEILTDDEFTALEKWWPEVHSSFALRFSLDGDGVTWSTLPCRECDASGRSYSLSIRNRNKKAVKKTMPAASLKY